MELVALLSSGKGTWGQVAGLIKRGEWSKVILLGDSFASNFTIDRPTEFIKLDMTKPTSDIKAQIKEKLKGKIEGLEVALSIASGSGKEHMAIISALIELPVGMKFAILTKDGIIYL